MVGAVFEWLAPVAAAALGHHASLQWQRQPGAEACIGEQSLATAVKARLGTTSGDEVGAIELAIDGVIERVADGWHATILSRSDQGEPLGQRELREPGADCHAIDGTLVLVLALIVDPDLLDEPAALGQPVPPAAATPATIRAVAPAPRTRWQLAAGLSAVASRGLLPGLAAGGMASISLEPPRMWPIEIALAVWPYDRGFATPGGATFTQVTGGVALCPPLERNRFSACVGAQAGELRARGFGYDQNQRQTDALLDATAELRLDLRITAAFVARIDLGVWVPMSRPRFVVDRGSEQVPVYQPAAVAGVTQIALWAHF